MRYPVNLIPGLPVTPDVGIGIALAPVAAPLPVAAAAAPAPSGDGNFQSAGALEFLYQEPVQYAVGAAVTIPVTIINRTGADFASVSVYHSMGFSASVGAVLTGQTLSTSITLTPYPSTPGRYFRVIEAFGSNANGFFSNRHQTSVVFV